jgi:YidC/Oxa1 family membrane protein insertase
MYEQPIGTDGGWGWLQWIITYVADFTFWVSNLVGGHYWLGLVIVTLIVRSAGWPIYSKSNAMTTNMQQAQPELNKIQEKYKDRKDEISQKKQQQETLEVYKTYNINPLGCLLPFLQMPIFIIMYQVVRRVPLSIGETINGVVSKDYSSLNYTFLGMDLKAGVDFSVFSSEGIMAGLGTVFPEILLAIFVGVLMFGYQKYAQSKPEYLQNKKFQSEQASKTANQMKYMSYFMVFMLVSIAITNNGIALYWIVGNGYQFFQTYMNRRSGYKKFLENQKSKSVVF